MDFQLELGLPYSGTRVLARHVRLKGRKFVDSDPLEHPMRCPPLIKLACFTVAIFLFCAYIPCLRAQTSDAQTSEPQSWIKTTESHPANMNPTRTTESHQKSAAGTV